MRLLAAAILNCYFIICCKGVSVTLGITQSTYVENGTSLLMECLLTSGNIDLSTARGWLKDGVSLISDGISTGSGSGYTETVTAGTKAFSLYTPPMDFSFDGSVFQCEYGFLQATLNIMISEFGSTDQSKEDCIDGKSIEKCWFSLSKVYPGVESQNLTVTYKDDTVENITSMLNRTSQLNTDGKTLAFFFRIESSNSGMSISKDVKAVKLSFIAGPVSRTLTIMIKDCSLDIFLYGFLPVFLIVLIVSIAIIIILKIERLPQQFGELAWKKLVIIAICFVVAIIIGVCLGLLIKGCDNKYLALGLSLLFGILIVVALIFALIYYHKKCESRRGVPERVLEYIPCSQSGQ